MERILVSACLMGQKVRYNGSDLIIEKSDLERLGEIAELIPFCPEVAGGLPTPRPPAEIFPANGDMVLIGDAFIKTAKGDNVTNAFLSGAQKALSLCREHNIKYAILTESSPSCGSSLIYNGRFEGQKVEGQGVTTALLRQSGVSVYSQFSIEDLISHLKH